MHDTLAHLISYALGIWRHRWLAMALAWVIAILGWSSVSQMPESYVANARVYVDTSSILGPLMRGLTVSPNTDQRLDMMSRTLLSRPNLERLARMTDMDLTAVNEQQKSAMIQRLEDSISLSSTRSNNALYSIRVTHSDRETARRLAEALITVFIESSTRSQNTDNSEAQTFIDRQIAEAEKRLVEAEERLAQFKKVNVDTLPGDSGDYYSRLRLARGQLQEARLRLREVESRRAELDRQLDGEEPIFIAGEPQGSSGNSALDQHIQNLHLELDRLLSRYTEQHPEVSRLGNLIEELESERQANSEQLGGAQSNAFSTLSSSPVYQGMRSLLAETRAQAAELEVRVSEYQDRVEELEAKVNQIPEVEARLKQLNRDYEVIYRQHQQLLERRESARLSEDLQRDAADVSFRVVDPPFVPSQPSEPNKPLLNVAVLFAALGTGGALALLMSLLHPIITDARMLTHTTGLPLLGTVTHQKSKAQIRRARLGLASFVASGGALLLVFAVVTLMPELIP